MGICAGGKLPAVQFNLKIDAIKAPAVVTFPPMEIELRPFKNHSFENSALNM